MRIAVLGTGIVGRTIGARLAQLGHEVALGTRDPQATLARGEGPREGMEPLAEWLRHLPAVRLAAYGEAVAGAEIVLNATSGAATPEVLAAAGADNLAGKILMDISNPLDSSSGFPPTLLVANTDSLAEQIQRGHPQTRVVKTLNIVNASVMARPGELAGGDHTMFVAGNDAEAKQQVTELLTSFGWRDVIDIGDITAARGMEMYVALWIRLMGTLGSATFNIKLVH